MNEKLLEDKEFSQNKLHLIHLSNLLKNDMSYQKILILLFTLSTIISCLTIVIYPTQKNLPDYKCLNENETTLLNENKFSYTKTITDKKCVELYCNKNSDENIQNFSIIQIDLSSVTNFVTIYDAFCDYDYFFANLNFLINLGRIFGCTLLAYITDKYGRLIAFKIHIYISIFAYIGIFIFESRAFFYLFNFFTACSMHFYYLLCVIAHEMMTQKTFSAFSSFMGIVFSLNGLLCMVSMIYVKSVYFIYLYVLIFVIAITYLANKYLIETFDFSIKMNLFEECFKDIKYLNKILNIDIKKSPKNYQILKTLENYIYSTDTSKKSSISSRADFFKEKSLEKKGKKFYTEDSGIFGPYKILFRTRELLFKFFLVLINMVVIFTIYYGPLYNIEYIMDDIYLATLLIYLSESLGLIFAGFVLQYYGRKKIIVIGYLINLLIYFALCIFDLEYLKIVLIFFAFMTTSISATTNIIFINESFNVEVKNSVVSLSVNISCVFLMFLPYILRLLPNIFILFFTVCIFGLMAIYQMKETLKKENSCDF